ncbi:hypothetical protein PFUGPA_03709 [Plasmodium falciparum Palo Alto/Uganda]|nr:hypothetical protein PFUGPA_03709 [Plasmodium falciparum Palo Alto/Uganda]
MCNIFLYNLEKEKKIFQGSEVDLYVKVLSSLTNEIEFYKIIYKSVCSYSHQDTFYEEEIMAMLRDLSKDDIVKVIMSHLQK